MEEFLRYLVIILGSSVGVALINWAATARNGRADRDATAERQTRQERHEATLQSQRENHEAKLRRQADHDEARKTFLPLAESLALYFTKEAFDLHWAEVGIFVFPSTERPILDKKAAVVDAVRSIMWGHPTRDVREKAQSIYSDLVSYWFDTDRQQAKFYSDERIGLSQDEANKLEEAAEELIQLIHADPPRAG
ncbi:MAG: hypothetical protein ACOYX5_15985 [Actinomycetota bacterium]